MPDDFKIAQMVAALKGGGGGDDEDVPITNEVRQGWNEYLGWLKGKGLAGNDKLDKDGLGMKMIDEYRKENPNATLTKEMVVPIQKDFRNYRNYTLKQIDEGKAELDPHVGATRENFMQGLSIVDGIPGKMTTSYQFPLSWMRTMNNGKVIKTENKGFAVAK